MPLAILPDDRLILELLLNRAIYKPDRGTDDFEGELPVRTSKTGFLLLLLAAGMLPGAMAQAAASVGLPYPSAATPKPIDLGELKAQSRTTPISATIALGLPELNDAEALLKALNTPGDPQFHPLLK